MSTAVDRVFLNFGSPEEAPLERMNLEEARRHLADGQFPAGSMGPKIEAAIRFLELGGTSVVITSPERISEALRGEAGTWITV